MVDKVKALEALKRHTQYINDCWVFTGSTSGRGYGQVRINNRLYMAHRLSAHIHKDFDLNDEEHFILHAIECKYRQCWNPEHLRVGTQKDNIKDSIAAGTFTGPQKSAEMRSRKVMCKRGHEFSRENTSYAAGKRRCLACHSLRQRKYNA